VIDVFCLDRFVGTTVASPLAVEAAGAMRVPFPTHGY
jgi:hypothetical protein